MQAHSPLMPSNQSGHVVMTTDLTNGKVPLWEAETTPKVRLSHKKSVLSRDKQKA